MYTQEQIFTKVMDHLVEQKERATHARGTCAYRDAMGRTCSIGCLIPEAEYDNRIEGNDVEYVIHMCPTVAAIAADVGAGFLDDLRHFHDEVILYLDLSEYLMYFHTEYSIPTSTIIKYINEFEQISRDNLQSN